MHYYSLYNQLKLPEISFILTNFDNNKNNFFEAINQIKCLITQNYSNFEIIFNFQKIEKYKYKIFHNKFKRFIKDNTIKIYIKEENKSKSYSSYSSLINLSKGSYTIFIEKLILLNNLSIHDLSESKKLF